MNYSDVLPFLSGLLLFALAGYSVRLARLFHAVRTGWLVFSSLAFLALLYLVLLASPFRGTVLWGARADITYSLISLVLLVAMARLEILFKERFRKANAAENSVSQWQSNVEKQYEKLAEDHKELQETKTRLEAELAEQKRLLEQTRNDSSELLPASGSAGQEIQQVTAALSAQLEEHKRELQEAEKLHQEHLAVARGVVEELGKTADALRVEIDTLRAEGGSLRAEIETLQADNGHLRAEMETLQADNLRLQADIDGHQSETVALHGRYDQRLEETQGLQSRFEQQKAELERLQSQLNKQAQARKELEAIRKKLGSRSMQPRTSRMVAGLTRDLGRLRTGVDSVNLAVDHLVQSGVSRLVQSSRLLGQRSSSNGMPALRHGPGRKVLPDPITQLVRDLSGEHRAIVRKIDNLRRHVEKVQTTVANHQERDQAADSAAANEVNGAVKDGLSPSSPLPSAPTPAADEIRSNPGAPARDGVKTVNADLREHLLNNVTETGTTSGDDTSEVSKSEEANDSALLDEFHAAP